ncbi:MAG: hypothetical protein GF307_06720 [candidate division Zixibacteria bacterium]|nr:hypothetical protein [candidate division Zixibacteria bacterium]
MSTRRPMRIRLDKRRENSKIIDSRLNIALMVIGLAWAALIARNFDLALFRHSQFSRIALSQQKVKEEIRGNRGDILDRRGVPMSWNISMPSIYAVSRDMDNPRNTASQLARLCGGSSGKLREGFEKRPCFCWVDREVNPRTVEALRRQNLKGVYVTKEPRRRYLSGDMWRYLIGNVDIDGHGIAGAELAFEDLLYSEGSKIWINRDARGRRFDAEGEYESARNAGNSVMLTIDANLQDILVQKLRDGVERFEAKGAYGVFLEVGSSEVLAMGQYYPKGVSSTRNVVISDTYEPGSTFKLVTIAAAVNSGRFSAFDIIDCENGSYKVGYKTIKDYKKSGKIPFRRAVELSSNIAMIKVAHELGRELIYRTAIDFGFNSKTGIELPGEAVGVMHEPKDWSDIEHATVSFGNGLTVTALQMVNAYAAVGAKGILYQPHILKAVLSPEDELIYEKKPEPIRRVISERTAATLLEFFTGVVDSGTAVAARIEGLKIAGKTGTSRKVKEDGRGYYYNRYITSFVGMYPAEDPVIVGYVVFDDPEVNKTASTSAAPIFREILMEYLCSASRNFDIDDDKKVRAEFCDYVEYNEMNGDDFTDNRKYSEKINSFDDLNKMVLGKPLRTAINMIHNQGYDVKIKGSGIVRECFPKNHGDQLIYYLRCG